MIFKVGARYEGTWALVHMAVETVVLLLVSLQALLVWIRLSTGRASEAGLLLSDDPRDYTL